MKKYTPKNSISKDSEIKSTPPLKPKISKLSVLQIILVLGAVIALSVPFIRNIYFMRHTTSIVADFKKEEPKINIEEKEMQNQEINEYNFYSEDPFNNLEVQEGNEPKIIGILSIPAVNEELPVYDKTTTLSLSEGTALLQGTHFPLGKLNETSVITGHHGTNNATIFQNIDKLKNGDVFIYDDNDKKYYYEVYGRLLVLPYETDKLNIVKGQNTMILLTCMSPEPLKGINTHRLLLYGRLTDVKYSEEETVDVNLAPQVKTGMKFKYMALGASCLLVFMIYLIVSLIRGYMKDKKKMVTEYGEEIHESTGIKKVYQAGRK